MANNTNIVYFVADQLRADSLHHLGNPASLTPNLDRLASEGVSFSNAFCQNPVCVPSRCSFLTGLYPHTTGHRTMHFLQNEDEPNILKTMKENGYEVIWCGRNDVIPADRSKDNYCDEYIGGVDISELRKKVASEHKEVNYSFYFGQDTTGMASMVDESIVEGAIEYLRTRAKQSSNKPFFMYLTINLPHPPYTIKKPFYGATDRSKLPPRRKDLNTTNGKPAMLHGIHDKQKVYQWSEEQFDELRGTYLDMVYRFDDLFGKFKEALSESGYEDNTSIFVFSDHGDYTGDYGICEKSQNTFDDPVCHVPFIVKPAKSIECKPRTTDALVELVDLTATVADICDIDLNYTQFGKSIVEVLAGKDEHRDEVHCEGGRIHGERQCMELGHDESSPYWPRLSTQAMEGPEHSKAVMCRTKDYKFVKRLYEDDELYDLNNDPQEMNNLIHEEKYKDLIIEFDRKVLEHLLSTGDYVPNRRDKR